MSVHAPIVGAVTATGFVVVVRVDENQAALAVATNEGMSSPTVFGPVDTDAHGIARIEVTGRNPNTRYWFVARGIPGGYDHNQKGTVATPVTTGQPESFRFIASSCAGSTAGLYTANGVSDSPVFDELRTDHNDPAPAFFAHLGDLYYRNIATPDVGAFRQAYTDTFAQQRQALMYRAMPLVFSWDDHDYGPNNSDGTHIGKHAAAQAYRERVPHYPLPQQSGAIYHHFTRGRVLFIVSDTRFHRTPNAEPDGPGKTMLGAAQKQWMRDLLEHPPDGAEFLVWLNPTPWMGFASDTWNGFGTERGELRDMFRELGWERRMVCLNGDYHGLAMDSGSGNEIHTGARFPVYICGSLDSLPLPPVGTPTTQYDLGPTQPGGWQYGVVDVADNGTIISVATTTYDHDGVWGAHTVHVDSTGSGQAPRNISAVYDPDLSRVRITAAENEPYVPVEDTFSREVTGGWGTADTGQDWSTAGGAAHNYRVVDGHGHVDPGGRGTQYVTLLDIDRADVDMVATVSVDTVATGENIVAELLARNVDGNNRYRFRLHHTPNGELVAQVGRVAGGTYTTLGSDTVGPHVPERPSRVRARVVGQNLLMKVWPLGIAEPGGWQLALTDDSVTDPGAIGTLTTVRTGNTNTLPLRVSYDHIGLVGPDPQELRVERTVGAGRWVPVRGGTQYADPGVPLVVDDYEYAPEVENTYRVATLDGGVPVDIQSVSINPGDDQIWLKNLDWAWLNTPILPTDQGGNFEVTYAARAGVHDVIGRSRPVTTTDVRSAAVFTLQVVTRTTGEADALRAAVGTGGQLYLHGPPGWPHSGMHVQVGDVGESLYLPDGQTRIWQLPMTRVDAPPADQVPTTTIWRSVIRRYEDWDEVLADVDTWWDLVDQVAEPADALPE